MDIITTFLVTVAAGVVCLLISKWLDRHDKDNEQPSGCFATIKEKKNPSTVLHYGRGVRSLPKWKYYHFPLPTGIIAYAAFFCNIQITILYLICNSLLLFTCHRRVAAHLLFPRAMSPENQGKLKQLINKHEVDKISSPHTQYIHVIIHTPIFPPNEQTKDFAHPNLDIILAQDIQE